MRKYELDFDKSKKVFEYFKDLLKMKECYNNVFRVVSLSPKTFRSGKWKVAYGYMQVFNGLYCRHCFIIDENDKVIDPTLFTRSEAFKTEYYVMKIFDDIDEYFNAIKRENYFPALCKGLKENSVQAQIWADNNGYLLIG